VCAALSGPAEADRDEGGAPPGRRGHEAFGRGPRLPRRDPPARYQALLRLDRRGCRRRGWLARRPPVIGRPRRWYHDAVAAFFAPLRVWPRCHARRTAATQKTKRYQ